MQAGWWTAHRTQCTPALTARSSFLRAPSPGHVRKDYGRSHPPEAPCPAQVCTSAHWLGCMLPTPQPLEAFPGDPGTQRTLLALPPHHLTAVASAASHRAPHPAPQRGCLLDGCLSETLFLRGRGVLGTAVSRFLHNTSQKELSLGVFYY